MRGLTHYLPLIIFLIVLTLSCVIIFCLDEGPKTRASKASTIGDCVKVCGNTRDGCNEKCDGLNDSERDLCFHDCLTKKIACTESCQQASVINYVGRIIR